MLRLDFRSLVGIGSNTPARYLQEKRLLPIYYYLTLPLSSNEIRVYHYIIPNKCRISINKCTRNLRLATMSHGYHYCMTSVFSGYTSVAKRKRGRPRKKDSKPRKKPTPTSVAAVVVAAEAALAPTPAPAPKLAAVYGQVQESLQRKKEAADGVAQAQAALEAAQTALEKAQQKATEADDNYQSQVKAQADHMLTTCPSTLKPKDQQWLIFYRLLVQFHTQFGHTCLRKKDGTDYWASLGVKITGKSKMRLGWWVHNQRALFQIRNKDKGESTLPMCGSVPMQPYQTVLLDRINFEREPTLAIVAGYGGSKWMRHFDRLTAYKEEHGDCNVPNIKTQKGHDNLAMWCRTQRLGCHNSRMTPPKKPFLSPERIQILTELGFDWGEPNLPIPWETRFEELKECTLKHGHANVPWRWSENLRLAGWVNRMRNECRDEKRCDWRRCKHKPFFL